MKSIKLNINLLLVIVTAVLFQIFLFMQKENLHIDEMFSFVLANNEKGIFLFKDSSEIDNKSLSGDYFYDYVRSDKGGSFFNTWQKVSEDNHMPVFFMLLKIFNIFDNLGVNYLSGIILNILVLIVGLVGFYKLSNFLFKNKHIAVISVGILAFSQAIISLEIYIRMYLLLFTFSTWLIYFICVYCSKHKCISMVFVFTVLSILTHYYSLIFCFLLTASMELFLLSNKKYKQMIVLAVIMLCAVGISYLLFPYMINTGLHGERGVQFWNIVQAFISNPYEIFENKFPLFIDSVFGGWIYFLFWGLLFIGVFAGEKFKISNIWLPLFLCFLGYCVILSLVMPVMRYYQIRYFASVIPLFVLLNMYLFIYFANKINIDEKRIFIGLCFVLFFLFIKNVFFYESPFFMRGTRESRKLERLVNNADIWWGFGGGSKYSWMIYMYVDKLANAENVWILDDYYSSDFIDFSNEELKNKKYAYLLLPKQQEQNVEGAIDYVMRTTGRKAYYLFTSKFIDVSAIVFEASVFLICPF